MKRFVSIVLAATMILLLAASFTSCKKNDDGKDKIPTPSNSSAANNKYANYTAEAYAATDEIYEDTTMLIDGKELSKVKIGAILSGDENSSRAHIDGLKKMCDLLGMDVETQLIYKTKVNSEACMKTVKTLVGEGCGIVFDNEPEHRDGILKVAKLYPDVQFCHVTNNESAESELDNVANYGSDIFEAQYISGIYAGYKILELKKEKPETVKEGAIEVGYVATASGERAISAYTAFYLGIKKVVTDEKLYKSGETPMVVSMNVRYTGKTTDEAVENETANALIADGCALIGSDGNTNGVSVACETAGIYNVGYNSAEKEELSKYDITTAENNWTLYYCYAVAHNIADEELDTEWSEGYGAGAVTLGEVNKSAFSSADTYNSAVEAANAAIEEIKAEKLHVFDTSTWEIDGKTVKSTKTKAYKDEYGNRQYIKTDKEGVSYFAESDSFAAPAFAFKVDGIRVSK